MRASVSLLRIQSMRWRWVRSPALSRRRRPVVLLRSLGAMLDLGRALRPSNRSTRRRSTRRMVSRTHLYGGWEDVDCRWELFKIPALQHTLCNYSTHNKMQWNQTFLNNKYLMNIFMLHTFHHPWEPSLLMQGGLIAINPEMKHFRNSYY